MKTRITTGWTVQRALFLVMGTTILVSSILNREWFGILPGAYFAAMGLFAFGCAGGNCYGGSCDYRNGKPAEKQEV